MEAALCHIRDFERAAAMRAERRAPVCGSFVVANGGDFA
jgi:hypothetical protein